ncbi:hypothetical protein N7474_008717 [Penicillium riverlandense]|uniref:uncharacterized protein n=1 Tax=Penicillium riverlandense TaxID=1903569 RepID=UPI0025493BBF|nr:uncharacterized protein N7474_008717 [Penicillium riverlandense]KAJ5812416.1 hypothetical protein N7474_008717 [Penicillium riverlandense]
MNFLGLDSQNTPPVVSISASQSLNASATTQAAISTGLTRLDEALNDATDEKRPGGILRGQITEVFGPPGVGKTSLALNTAFSALRNGGKVVWIDTGSPLPNPRLKGHSLDNNNFIYFRATTLPHLLALLLRPPRSFPPDGTALLVIDSVSSLFSTYFPNAAELKERLTQGKITDKAQLQWLLNRKWNVASDLATHLARIASRNIAVLAINQTHTKIKGQPRATLHPVLAGGAWESNVQARIMMYRDLPNCRLAEMTKRAGRTLLMRSAEWIVPFRIEADGLREVEEESEPDLDAVEEISHPAEPVDVPTAASRKRKVNEVADSQDEDDDDDSEGGYEWMDEALLGENA